MTYREKLKQDHPEWSRKELYAMYSDQCPDNFMEYTDIPKYEDGEWWCGDDRCQECWDREISATTTEKEEIHEETPPQNNENSCDTCIHNAVCKYRDDFTRAIELVKDIPGCFEIILRCKNNL